MFSEKQNKYNMLIERFEKAKSEAFHYEALWILFAIFEDRTSSFLRLLGVFGNNKTDTITTKKRDANFFENIFELTTTSDKWFDTLFKKTSRLKKIVEWANKTQASEFKIGKSILNALNKNDNPKRKKKLKETLNNLDKWRKSRNTLTHNLIATTIFTDDNYLKNLVDDGECIFRQLDFFIEEVRGVPYNMELATKRMHSIKEGG